MKFRITFNPTKTLTKGTDVFVQSINSKLELKYFVAKLDEDFNPIRFKSTVMVRPYDRTLSKNESIQVSSNRIAAPGYTRSPGEGLELRFGGIIDRPIINYGANPVGRFMPQEQLEPNDQVPVVRNLYTYNDQVPATWTVPAEAAAPAPAYLNDPFAAEAPQVRVRSTADWGNFGEWVTYPDTVGD